MKIFLYSIVLMIALEGASLALFPEFMRSGFQRLAESDSAALRRAGLTAVVISCLLGWLVRHF